jgi:DNA-binding transcriptional regulator YiaG
MTTTSDDTLQLARVRGLLADGDGRRIRLRARLTLADVGGACGVSPSAVHRWENGSTPRTAPALRYSALLQKLEQVIGR